MKSIEHPRVPVEFRRLSGTEIEQCSKDFAGEMARRRSIRDFSSDPVPRSLVENAIRAAHTAPSGANRQPWSFVAVSDPAVKAEIRVAAEAEEREFWEGGRVPEEWLEALAPLGLDWHKPFLEIAPWIVVIFKEIHGVGPGGSKITNYYVNESVGIACGLFITAVHRMGLATLTHTPQPMRFLNSILGRPANERPYILFPIGFPADDCTVPDISKKPLNEVVTWFEE